MDPAERAIEIEQIHAIDNWPNWPLLPMKKWEDGKLEVGLLLDGLLPVRPIIYKANLYAQPSEVLAAETIEFPSWEALLDAGWRVD